MANGYLVAKSGCVYKHNQRDQGETEMAEGLLGGILGGEDEEKAASIEAGPEAFVAAVATNIANHSPEVAAKTATFFEEQTELVKAQSKSVEAEHEYFEAEWGHACSPYGCEPDSRSLSRCLRPSSASEHWVSRRLGWADRSRCRRDRSTLR